MANSMATVVSSRALTLKRAVIIAAFFEFAGAFLVGSHVTNTVRKGIIDPNFIVLGVVGMRTSSRRFHLGLAGYILFVGLTWSLVVRRFLGA